MSANDTYTIHMYSYDAYSDNTYTGMYGNNTYQDSNNAYEDNTYSYNIYSDSFVPTLKNM